MPALRGQGNADNPATQYTVTGHTPGPWKSSPLGVITGGQFSATSIATVPTEAWCLSIFSAVQDQKPQELIDWLNTVLDESKANAALIAAAPWHALLLRAVLKGWTLDPAGLLWKGATLGCLVEFDLSVDANGLPACPDADTYERIRKQVEGE